MDKEKKSPQKKAFDITISKKSAPSTTSRPLILENRPIMKQDPMVTPTSATDHSGVAASHESDTKATRESVIPVPIGDVTQSATESQAESTQKPTDTDEASDSKQPTQTETEAEVDSDASKDPEIEGPSPIAGEPADTETAAIGDTPGQSQQAGDSGGLPKPDLEAIKEAEEAAKQQAEWDRYIDSREFFVPVDAVQRKRSIRTSIGLTILLIFLCVALVDLMLDSGFIVLLQRIPHTHFFR